MNKVLKNIYDICLSFLLTLHVSELLSKIIVAIVVVLVNIGIDYTIQFIKKLKISKSTKDKIEKTIINLENYIDDVDKNNKK